MKKCPYCAEEIRNEAIKCRFCGEMLDTKFLKKDIAKDDYQTNKYTRIAWQKTLLISTTIFFVLLVALFNWEGSLKSKTVQSLVVSFIVAIVLGGMITYFKNFSKNVNEIRKKKKKN